MRVLKMTFVETDGAVDGVIRTYDTDIKERTVDDILDATDGGQRMSPLRLASVARGIISPTGASIDSHIDNGWEERRLMFAMVVEIGGGSISKEYEYIVGYTDHKGYSRLDGRNTSFDPKMKLYFNSITRVKMTESEYRNRTVWQPRIGAHDQVLLRDSVTGPDRRRGPTPSLLRPIDMFKRSDTSNHFASYLNQRDNRATNLTGSFNSRLASNSRLNNSPTPYLERLMKAAVSAASNPSGAYLGDNTEEDIIATAVDSPSINENILEADPYLEEVKRASNILSSGYMTWEELIDFNPELEKGDQLILHPLSNRKELPNLSAAISWRSDEPEAIAATIIAQSLPALMIQSMYSRIDHLILNSAARYAEDKVLFANAWPFLPGLDVRSSQPYFEKMMEDVVLRDVTKDGLFDIYAKINANIDQDIEIWISMDGGEEMYFVFPAYADSLMSPVISDSMDTIETLSDKLVNLTLDVGSRRNRNSPNHTDKPGIVLSSADRGPVDDDVPPSRDRKRNW